MVRSFYLRRHSPLTPIPGRAIGTPSSSVPWEVVKEDPKTFLNLDIAWLPNIPFKDPSKIKLHDAVSLLQHWQSLPPRTFIWRAYVVNKEVCVDNMYPAWDPQRRKHGDRRKAHAAARVHKKAAESSEEACTTDEEGTDTSAPVRRSGRTRRRRHHAKPQKDSAAPDCNATEKGKAKAVETVPSIGYSSEDDIAALMQIEIEQSEGEEDKWESMSKARADDMLSRCSPAAVATSPVGRRRFMELLAPGETLYAEAVEHVWSVCSRAKRSDGFRIIPGMEWASWASPINDLGEEFTAGDASLDVALDWLQAGHFKDTEYCMNRSGKLEQVVLAVGLIYKALKTAQFAEPDQSDSSDLLLGSTCSFHTITAILDQTLGYILVLQPPTLPPTERHCLRRRQSASTPNQSRDASYDATLDSDTAEHPSIGAKDPTPAPAPADDVAADCSGGMDSGTCNAVTESIDSHEQHIEDKEQEKEEEVEKGEEEQEEEDMRPSKRRRLAAEVQPAVQTKAIDLQVCLSQTDSQRLYTVLIIRNQHPDDISRNAAGPSNSEGSGAAQPVDNANLTQSAPLIDTSLNKAPSGRGKGAGTRKVTRRPAARPRAGPLTAAPDVAAPVDPAPSSRPRRQVRPTEKILELRAQYVIHTV